MSNQDTGQYEWLPHDADMLLEVKAESESAIFRIAATAIVECMLESPPRAPEKLRVSLRARDREELLVAWLNEIIYLTGGGSLLPASIVSLEFTDEGLVAWIEGERADPSAHRYAREIKAATYHGLSITGRAGDWHARILFDV